MRDRLLIKLIDPEQGHIAVTTAWRETIKPLLQAAASVWPEGRPPQVLRYENGRLSLGAPGIGADEISRMKATLEPAGWRIDQTDNQVTLSRPTTPGAAR